MLFTTRAQQVKLTPARSGVSVLFPRGTLLAFRWKLALRRFMLTLRACQPGRCLVSTLPRKGQNRKCLICNGLISYNGRRTQFIGLAALLRVVASN